MWEWSEEFRQIQPHHLSNRVHLDMLIVDTHADRLKLHDFSALKKALRARSRQSATYSKHSGLTMRFILCLNDGTDF